MNESQHMRELMNRLEEINEGIDNNSAMKGLLDGTNIGEIFGLPLRLQYAGIDEDQLATYELTFEDEQNDLGLRVTEGFVTGGVENGTMGWYCQLTVNFDFNHNDEIADDDNRLKGQDSSEAETASIEDAIKSAADDVANKIYRRMDAVDERLGDWLERL